MTPTLIYICIIGYLAMIFITSVVLEWGSPSKKEHVMDIVMPITWPLCWIGLLVIFFAMSGMNLVKFFRK